MPWPVRATMTGWIYGGLGRRIAGGLLLPAREGPYASGQT